MSQLTRLASTDDQEKALVKVEKAFKKAGCSPAGFTTIGKSPQTVIVDISHHDGKIQVDSDGIIEINGGEVDDVPAMARDIATMAPVRRQRHFGVVN